MIEYKAPKFIPSQAYRKISIFLAGSIEMGAAEDWQEKVVTALKDHDVNVFNPRRDDWDSTWEQKISNPQFYEQVSWELDALDRSDIIFMYFSPETKSPISLLELGLYLSTGNMIVCCPEGFWRKGNVDIVCEKYGVAVHRNINAAIEALKDSI